MNTSKSDKFVTDVAAVMAMRLSMLPIMWMLDPAKAEKETKKMFSEKESAMQESIQQMIVAPMMFSFDVWQGLLNGDKDGGIGRAQQQAENRISSPYLSRVIANRRRLSKGG